MPTSFINTLKVPTNREADFLMLWDEGAAYVATCPGFIATSLHRAESPTSEFQFFTVAVWQSPEYFVTATSTSWWRAYRDRFRAEIPEFQPSPAVCSIVRDTQLLFTGAP